MVNRSPGELVTVRGREWVVLPSQDPDLLMLKPLGGSEEEITAIYLPFNFPEDKIKDFQFPSPEPKDLGSFETAKLLYNATRLSFRNGAGPFRSFGKLSFRPRSFQLVPLLMALRQPSIRLMIADDVGIGKTIEAGMIIRELMDRGELNRFAVLCLPHLCEQWQSELKDKFGIEAAIIRSGSISSLEKHLQGDESIYQHYPFQIISIDYVKSDNNRSRFLQEMPGFIVVDEAHSCASDTTHVKSAQQLRFRLLKDIANKDAVHLVLLTATPHSGKQAQFQSLLGLLNNDFDQAQFDLNQEANTKKVAEYFIQRKRKDIKSFIQEDTPFPERIAKEIEYSLTNDYVEFYKELIAFARTLVKDADTRHYKQRLKYWAALGLLRGVMSSPAAGVQMLQTRAIKVDDGSEEATISVQDNPVFDPDKEFQRDSLPTEIIQENKFTDSENKQLKRLAEKLQLLGDSKKDAKANAAAKLIETWLKAGKHPVVFCRYIETAKYLGAMLKEAFGSNKKLEIAIITGEMPDELRKETIEALSETGQRLLVCTDCLSEGINLQHQFNALLHYDLPWNPNRLEQREGRIDRFGQTAKEVETFLLVGKDNPMDGVVLRVLLRKARLIQQQIGISVPFPENSETITEAVLNAVLLNPQTVVQGSLFDDETIRSKESEVEKLYEAEAKRHEKIRKQFAQISIIKQLDIEAELHKTDEVLGNPATLKEFVIQAIQALNGQMLATKLGFKLALNNMPASIKALFKKTEELISFDSPTPDGYHYIGRNHAFVEQLCNLMMAAAFEKDLDFDVARAAVFRTNAVTEKTVLIQFRVRNVIKSMLENREIVAEEALLWAYTGSIEDGNHLDVEEATHLLVQAKAMADINKDQQAKFLMDVLGELESNKIIIEKLAKERSKELVRAHEKYRKALNTGNFEVGTLIPPDVLGVYVLFPLI